MSTIYCTYLTTYFGNKLPMFYIGSTSVSKIKNGYRGSVSSKQYKTVWMKELKENQKIIFYHNPVLLPNKRSHHHLAEQSNIVHLYSKPNDFGFHL